MVFFSRTCCCCCCCHRFPLVMNIIQFWIIDTIVKHKDITQIRLHHRDDDEEDVENLLDSMEGQSHDYPHHHQLPQQSNPINDSRLSPPSKQNTIDDQQPLLSDHMHQRDSFDLDKENAMEIRQALDGQTHFASNSLSSSGNSLTNNNAYELGSPKTRRDDWLTNPADLFVIVAFSYHHIIFHSLLHSKFINLSSLLVYILFCNQTSHKQHFYNHYLEHKLCCITTSYHSLLICYSRKAPL